MSFDPTKPVQTRDGRKVRVLCTDLIGGSQPIVAAITRLDGEEAIHWLNSDGSFGLVRSGRSGWDLINIPVETVKYTNYYGPLSGCGNEWDTQADAMSAIGTHKSQGIFRVTRLDGVITKVELA